jgi:hypothetical protein
MANTPVFSSYGAFKELFDLLTFGIGHCFSHGHYNGFENSTDNEADRTCRESVPFFHLL